jgi:hypothetical protein
LCVRKISIALADPMTYRTLARRCGVCDVEPVDAATFAAGGVARDGGELLMPMSI